MVFSVTIPALVGEEWSKWIKMVMTDGDKNEIVQLEDAIDHFMPGCFQQ